MTILSIFLLCHYITTTKGFIKSKEQIADKKISARQQENISTWKTTLASEEVEAALDMTSLSFIAASERLTAVGRLTKCERHQLIINT